MGCPLLSSRPPSGGASPRCSAVPLPGPGAWGHRCQLVRPACARGTQLVVMMQWSKRAWRKKRTFPWPEERVERLPAFLFATRVCRKQRKPSFSWFCFTLQNSEHLGCVSVTPTRKPGSGAPETQSTDLHPVRVTFLFPNVTLPLLLQGVEHVSSLREPGPTLVTASIDRVQRSNAT